jgi:hypothetical protein
MKRMLFGTSTFVALVCGGVVSGQTVAVKADHLGRGLTFLRGSDCFIITPRHVIGDADDQIEVVGPQSARAIARLEVLLPHDIGILRVHLGSGSTDVCAPWPQHGDVGTVVSSSRDGVLRSRREDGGEDQIPIYIVSSDFQEIEISPVQGVIQEGMSGSAIVVGQSVIGMLLDVDMRSGHGTAIRTDRIEDAILPYLGSSSGGTGPPLSYQDSVCASLRRLLDSSAEGFADAIGDAAGIENLFRSTIDFPRFFRGSGVVYPDGYVSFTTSFNSEGEAESAARRLDLVVGRCLNTWPKSAYSPGYDNLRGFRHRDPDKGTTVSVVYTNQLPPGRTTYILDVTVHTPEPQ